MASKVYFIDLRADFESRVLERLKAGMEKAGLLKIVGEGEILAIKLHFGEKGCTAYLKPAYVRTVIDAMQATKCSMFLTDTNTLYVGSRSDSVRHIRTAVENGFSYASMGIPVLIADGLRGTNHEIVKIRGKHFDEVKIASDIVRADSLLALSHVKGHDVTGLGGALKNIGMGGGSRAGKVAMHSDVRPFVSDKCQGCATCTNWCPTGAIRVKGKRASILSEACIGCAECLVVCPSKAVRVKWSESSRTVQEKIVEYALGATQSKSRRAGYINFVMDVAPLCDCYPFSDASIVPDVGILISQDPVAIDKASADLINAQVGLPHTAVKGSKRGSDKFKVMYPKVDWGVQIAYAAGLGLGKIDYTLVKI